MTLYLDDAGRLHSGWRFAISAVVVYLANYGAGNASNIVTGHQRITELIYRPLLLLLELAGFLLLTLLLDRPAVSIWAYNGLPRQRWLRETTQGALLGFSMITLAVVVIGAVFHLAISLAFNRRTIILAVAVVGITLAAAMAEELSFRGYPFQRLVEGLGATGGIIVLSAIFGAVHLGNPHISDDRFVQIFAFCNTLLIGIVLAFSYLRTGALWLPFGLHFGWNLTLGLIYGLPVSGITLFSVIVKSKASGPEWFLGGSYGIEGGLLGTLVILLGLGYVLTFVNAKHTPVSAPYMASLEPKSI